MIWALCVILLKHCVGFQFSVQIQAHDPSNPTSKYKYCQVWHSKLCVLPISFVCAFRMNLATNSDVVAIHCSLIWSLQWKDTVFSVKYKLNLCVQCTVISVLKTLSRLQTILTVLQWRRVVYCSLAHRHVVTQHKIVTFASSAVRTSDTKHCEHIHSKVAIYCYVVSPFTPISLT